MRALSLSTIRLLRNLGWSGAQIGRRLGFSKSRIEQLCVKHNLKKYAENPTCPHCGGDITADKGAQ